MLGNHKVGWFGETGLKDLMEVANAPYKSSHRFEDMYVCDPSAKYYGFKSWDGKPKPPIRREAQHGVVKTSTYKSRLLHPQGPRQGAAR